MKLRELVDRLGGRCRELREGPTIRDVQLDSRRVGVGDLFAALPGSQADGARFLTDAASRGAVAVLAPSELDLRTVTYGMPGLHLVEWVHPDARAIAGRAAALVHGEPGAELSLVGITGTNGKTTTAHILGHLLEVAGRVPAVLGTAGHRIAGCELVPASHTTPDAPELQRILRRHRQAGGDAAVMEVSSHALSQERTAGLRFHVAVFTNLTRDHLDYHGDIQRYGAAKARLFRGLTADGIAVVNRDDPAWTVMRDAARAAGARVLTYSVAADADLRASRLETGPEGTDFVIDGMGIAPIGLRLPLRGRFNVENALAAATAALALGASPSAVTEGLVTTQGAPGRLERIDAGDRGFQVLVDYAHTPDALERVLAELRATLEASGRLLVVFGCGGERDRGKRPEMGRAAGRLADIAVVTSDNPRGEDPVAILAEVLDGLRAASPEGGRRVRTVAELDRRRAIETAVGMAREGDVLLVAGKGHESRQWNRDGAVEFDDRQVLRELLA